MVFRRLVLRALPALALVPSCGALAANTFLFDATKAEMAGNADWVVDADSHNLSLSSASDGSGMIGGTESNPQRTPNPAASGITASTSENYWTGAISAWGVTMVKHGFGVESLPYNGSITYGNSSNTQDLTRYKVFVLDEPNILFTSAEKTAILTFVANGGGLVLVSDHGASDRNNDGNDSVDVINDFFINNPVKANPFGMSLNGNSVSTTSTQVDSNANDPLTHGAAGNVTSFSFNAGSTITIDPTANSFVHAAVWSSSTHTNANVMAAYAQYGFGRVVLIGDSSPTDDGTGDTRDTLFGNWNDNDNAALISNASDWAAGGIPEPTMIGLLPLAMMLMTRRARRR
jgi:hypothetical protein